MGEAKRRDAAGRQRLPFDSLEEAFRLAAETTVPPDAPPGARDVLRHWFLLGAGAFFDLQMHRMDPGSEPTDADLRRMDALYGELEAFRKEQATAAMMRGVPPGTVRN